MWPPNPNEFEIATVGSQCRSSVTMSVSPISGAWDMVAVSDVYTVHRDQAGDRLHGAARAERMSGRALDR